MKSARLVVLCLLFTAVVAADDFSVQFDEDVDFTTFRSFELSRSQLRSDRPELQFPAVLSSMDTAIRSGLKARGLAEVPEHGDLVAWLAVKCDDWLIGPYGRPSQPGRRGGALSDGPVSFTEATIVLDLKRGTTGELLWRGVYHDEEANPGELAEALPKDVTRLLASYPPKVRK